MLGYENVEETNLMSFQWQQKSHNESVADLRIDFIPLDFLLNCSAIPKIAFRDQRCTIELEWRTEK
jgi:hypothetical protein